MSSAKSTLIYFNLHDASVQMMTASEERSEPSIDSPLRGHYDQSPSHQQNHQYHHQQLCDQPQQQQQQHVSSRRHYRGHRQAIGVKTSRLLQRHQSAFGSLTSVPATQNRPLTGLILALLCILLLECTSPISCLDSFNDLEETQTALCEAFGMGSALGMESGTIPDAALSASSSYNEQSVGPQNARLNRELNGGAWCPATQLDNKNSGKEWIQVNFTEPYVITKIATQGRFGNGMGVEFAEQFWLHYTRDGINWIRWRNKYGENEIQGNVDTYSIVESVLSIPLIGVTAIRLLPISQHMRTCCVRFEIFGCPYQDGPISYSMMDGQYNGRFGDLIDDTYDGSRRENGYLVGGLGQLVDGLKGDDNYKVNKGFEWIGWRSAIHGYLSITFEFADIRNFTFASFHCNNVFSKDMQVFHSAKIWFSLDGVQWAPVPEDFEYMPDKVMEKARDVVIHLHHRVGRFIKFDLRFAARWLLISEVRFDSRPITRGMHISELDFVDLGPITTTPISSNRAMLREPIVLVIFAAVGFLLVVFVLIFFFLARKRKEKMTGSEYTTVPMKDVVSTPLYCEPHDFNRLSPFSATVIDPEYAVPDVIGNGGVTMLTINGTKAMANGSTMSPRTFRPNQTVNAFAFLNSNGQAKVNEDDGKARYYASTDVLGRSNLLSFEPSEPNPYNLENAHNKSGEHFLLGNNKINPIVSHTPPLPLMSQMHSSVSPPSSLSSNSSRIIKNISATNSDGFEGYENTQIHSSSTKTPSPVVPQIPVFKDTEISVIDGQFGYSKFGDCELGYLLRKNEKKLVILKTLSNEQFRDEFIEEMSEKWRLSSKCMETFACFFGYISKHDYLAMVIEYGDVDLKKYLRTSSSANIRFVNLIEIASQVAEGMQELHSRGFIHRDLAARNCLIFTSNFKVKITDSGAFISEYKNEYYNEVLPVRWMSYESILQGKFTAKSDVYSFGVTLWEIMNYCKVLPHEHLTEEELLSEIINENKNILDDSLQTDSAFNASTFYNHPFNDATHEYALLKTSPLPQPKECPNEIYDLILECCQRNETSRPEFHEIAYFLKKKCLNFRKI